MPLCVALYETPDRTELRIGDQRGQMNVPLTDWPLGKYKVKAILDNSDYGGLVQPFFWQTYQPTIEGEVLIEVNHRNEL
jgi:hypothetical protein